MNSGMSEPYPTNNELENSAVSAETGCWSEDHSCVHYYYDLNDKPSPGRCLLSLRDRNTTCASPYHRGVSFLQLQLQDDLISLGLPWNYTEAIDKGHGAIVAKLIRELKRTTCPFDFMTNTQNWIEFKVRTLGYGEDPQVVTDHIRDRIIKQAAKDIARVMNMPEQEIRDSLDQVIQTFSEEQNG